MAIALSVIMRPKARILPPQSLAGRNEKLPPFLDMKRTLFEGITSPASPLPKTVIAKLKGLSGGARDLHIPIPENDTREKLDLGFDAHE